MSYIIYIRNLFLLITIFYCTTTLLAQNTTTSYDTIYTKRKIKLINKDLVSSNYKGGDIDIYFSPLALIEPRPTIYVGGEYFLNDKLSLFVDLGYMVNITGAELNTQVDRTVSAQEDATDQTILNSAKANYTIKPEIRWYRQNSNSKDASYYGLRLIWRNVNYLKNQRVHEEYAFSTLTNTWSAIGDENMSIYRVKRQTLGLQFLIGTKKRFIKGINSNLYAGVGVRYISNQPENKAFNPLQAEGNLLEELNLEFLSFNKAYKIITMDFALGVRFGGRIKK